MSRCDYNSQSFSELFYALEACYLSLLAQRDSNSSAVLKYVRKHGTKALQMQLLGFSRETLRYHGVTKESVTMLNKVFSIHKTLPPSADTVMNRQLETIHSLKDAPSVEESISLYYSCYIAPPVIYNLRRDV